jgi:ABC-type transport system substrate-binding protein
MAIDRTAITRDNTFGAGTVAFADLPSFMWTTKRPSDPTPYDPSYAAKLLNSDGWLLRSDGVRERKGIPLRLNGAGFVESTTGRTIDLQVQQMLKSIGVDLTWKYSSYKMFYAPEAAGGTLARGDYDVADFPFNDGGADVENDGIYTCAKREPRGPNAARYCSPVMDALQSRSLSELNERVRLGYVGRIERLAASEVPYIFIYHVPRRLLQNPRLHRTHSNFLNLWYDVRNWYFE